MATMGTGKLARKRAHGEPEPTMAGFPEIVPANLIVSPIESAPIAAFGLVHGRPLGSSIMREGFTTDTGPLPTWHDLHRYQTAWVCEVAYGAGENLSCGFTLWAADDTVLAEVEWFDPCPEIPELRRLAGSALDTFRRAVE